MFGLKPSRRWQPAFYPFKREKFGRRMLAKTELFIKGPLFGCRMCGNCLLQETAFICPMECPKGMRNGPCGGITPEKNCYIDESRKCVWYAIYKRALRTGREDTLLEVLPPLDWSRVGTETWGDVVSEIRKTGTWNFFMAGLSKDQVKKNQVWDSVFKTIRQPDWWKGDSDYHHSSNEEPSSGLQSKLRTGEFVITTELSPPNGSSTLKLARDLELVKPFVDAVNFTDSSSATAKMSSISCCNTAIKLNAEPVMQIAARDTTRTGLQSSVLGAYAMGVKNILCVTGDNPIVGQYPVANMNVVDIDSVQMLWILRKMRDEGIYLDGRTIKHPPNIFIGAATTPFASDPELQALKDHKKVNAGAQFLQTNLVFEPGRLELWLEQLDKRDILNKVYILVGVTPLKNYRIAEFLHNRIPGVSIPDVILKRMARAGNAAGEEGIQIALEMIDSIKDKQGVNGLHIMTMGWESVIERIVSESGLSSKP